MGQVLFVVWRESVEALLVIGILCAWLRNGDKVARQGLSYLWLGVGLGLVAAFAFGFALLSFSETLSGEAQDYFQIAMVWIAAVLIVQMVLWMKFHGRTLKQGMETSLQKSTQNAQWWGVTLLAALAVAREGSETVIFLYGLGFGKAGYILPSHLAGVLIGFGLAFLTVYVLQLGGKLFSWRAFFRVTETMLLFLASGLVQAGVDKLIDKDILPSLVDPLWSTTALLDDTSGLGSLLAALTGYRAYPSLMNVLVCLVYWATVIGLIKYKKQRLAAQSQQI